MNVVQSRLIYSLKLNFSKVNLLLKAINKYKLNSVLTSIINNFDCYLVKIIIGSINPNDDDNIKQNKIFIKILDKLNIEYKLNSSSQILTYINVNNTPGLLYAFNNSLYCEDVITKYSGTTLQGIIKEPLCECLGKIVRTGPNLIFEVDKKYLNKALKILENVQNDSKEICINKFDIGKTICGKCGPELI